MSGLFLGLEMGKRALVSQQLALTTSGHNVANAATPGFSRQRVILTQTSPLNTTTGNIGTGVYASGITQVRDLFLSSQYRGDNGSLAGWESSHKALSQIELFFNEPSDKGMNQLITDFFNSWENLSTNPNARTTVVEKAKVLINAFHEHSSQLTELRESVDDDFKARTGEINKFAIQIANLNRQISSAELGGDHANDLRDQRDLLVDQLSAYAAVKTIERPNGTTAVMLGSMGLVDGVDYLQIETKTVQRDKSTATIAVWQNTNFEIDFSGGEMQSLQQTRDKTIPEMQKNLDLLATTIMNQVNSVHAAGIGANGSTGVNFFDPFRTSAATMALNVEVENDQNLIAASISGEPGDTRNAQAISQLRYDRVMQSGTSTINEFYASMIGSLGIRTEEAETLKDNYSLLVTQLENARQSVQGVSIDEEVTNMIKYQRAYEAAARVITFVDSALETVISGMGVTR
jgi:flagellar hook-associated protein 1 FlgK